MCECDSPDKKDLKGGTQPPLGWKGHINPAERVGLDDGEHFRHFAAR